MIKLNKQINPTFIKLYKKTIEISLIIKKTNNNNDLYHLYSIYQSLNKK